MAQNPQIYALGTVTTGLSFVVISAALVLIQQARAHGWKADEAIEKGRAMGLALDGPLRTIVESYLGGKS